MSKLRLYNYFTYCKLFPYMGDDNISPIADYLDTLMQYEFGNRVCGNVLTRGGSLSDFSSLTVAEQTAVAKLVYLKNKQTWQSLFDFVNANVKSWIDSESTTTTSYGKQVVATDGGSDTYAQTDKIAGFDSSEFSDDSFNEHETKYGKTVTDVNSGTDTVTKESRSQQAERLVDYTIKFWIDNGLLNVLVKDAVKTITLPLYESEDDE